MEEILFALVASCDASDMSLCPLQDLLAHGFPLEDRAHVDN